MRELMIATGNAGKFSEFKELIGGRFHSKSLADIGTPPKVEETGSTYFENALIKALRYHEFSGLPCLSDDSGLELDALGGQPGVDSAILGGEELSWPERWEFLYGELGTLPPEKWTARFRCILCFYDGRDVPRFFQGAVEGRILPEPRGGAGFGYDPIFFCTALGKTFGEASASEKQAVSHRAEAVRAFLSAGTT